MLSFGKSLAAFAGLSLFIVLLALTAPTRTQGQAGGFKLPFDGSASHDISTFRVSNQAQNASAKGLAYLFKEPCMNAA